MSAHHDTCNFCLGRWLPRNHAFRVVALDNDSPVSFLPEQDLKKQTALRLAQEQQQAQVVPGRTVARGVDPRTKHPVVTPQTLAARRKAATVPLVSQQTMPVHHYQRLHHHQQHHNPIPNEPPGMAPSYGAPQYYDQSQQGGKLNRSTNPRQEKFAEMSLAEYQNQVRPLDMGVCV
jgi:hypothetical protein